MFNPILAVQATVKSIRIMYHFKRHHGLRKSYEYCDPCHEPHWFLICDCNTVFTFSKDPQPIIDYLWERALRGKKDSKSRR